MYLNVSIRQMSNVIVKTEVLIKYLNCTFFVLAKQ